jgi:hypothetical protein
MAKQHNWYQPINASGGAGEPWSVASIPNMNRTCQIKAASGSVVIAAMDRGLARRVVVCVNALRGLPLASIEAMHAENWPRVLDEAWAEIWAEQRDGLPTAADLDAGDAELNARQATLPERVIEYEVDGHPWASEEGCAPRLAGLDEQEPAAVLRMTHAEAARR